MDTLIVVVAILLALWHFFLGILGSTAEGQPAPRMFFMFMSAVTGIFLITYVVVPYWRG